MSNNDAITLNVATRKIGKSNSRGLRNEKMVPGVVYGSKIENFNLSVDEFSVTKFSGQGYDNAIFNFKSDEKSLDGLAVLMKDVDVHPVTRRPVHVDFYALDMTAKVKVDVEVKFDGKAKGVTEDGGVFNVLLRNIEIECLPNDIPDNLAIDISNLAIGETLHISNLDLPSGVESTSPEDLALANVTAKKEEKEEEEGAATEAAAADAPAAEKKD